MYCTTCSAEISEERLEVLPDTKTCAKCSQAQKMVSFMDFSHKTAPTLVVVNPRNSEDLRLAQRAYRRSR